MLIRRHEEIYGNTLENEPAIYGNGNIIHFSANNNSSCSFKFKQQITEETGNGGTKDVDVMVPLKCLSNCWRTLEMPLIICETIPQLTRILKVFQYQNLE